MSSVPISPHQGPLLFWKMQGCGNHFVVCEPLGCLHVEEVKRICDSHFGIGADGVMAISISDQADFEVTMFNPDGTYMGMCGNGIRCAALYVVEKGLTEKNIIHFIVEGRKIECEVDGETIHVDMGKPDFDAKNIPLRDPMDTKSIQLSTAHRSFDASAVSMGNPHAVIFTDELPTSAELKEWGEEIEHHPLYLNRANVEFVKVINSRLLEVKVWERGAGATLACGTAACASVVAGVRRGIVDNSAEVELPGGKVKVIWDQTKNSVILSGPALKIFEGSYEINIPHP